MASVWFSEPLQKLLQASQLSELTSDQFKLMQCPSGTLFEEWKKAHTGLGFVAKQKVDKNRYSADQLEEMALSRQQVSSCLT
jgi:hypothetical protein